MLGPSVITKKENYLHCRLNSETDRSRSDMEQSVMLTSSIIRAKIISIITPRKEYRPIDSTWLPRNMDEICKASSNYGEILKASSKY
ncbi:hypothetical protein M8J77_013556 [Diaphorina citri]|nr:hypothetical protein M8J77_013556 [Diaphorina citri]